MEHVLGSPKALRRDMLMYTINATPHSNAVLKAMESANSFISDSMFAISNIANVTAYISLLFLPGFTACLRQFTPYVFE